MKKILSVLLAALLMLSVMPITAFAAEADTAEAVGAPAESEPVGDDSGSVGSVTWYYENSTGELTIGGTGELMDFDSGYETPWAAYRNSIETVTIGGSVTRIGSYAFDGCIMLDDVIFLTPLSSIGDCAFLNCGLYSVTLTGQPCDLQIGENAFAYEGVDGEITNFVSGFTIYSDTTAGFEYTRNRAFMHFAFTVNDFWGETNNCHWSFDTTTDTLTISPKGNDNCAMDLPHFWARDMALSHFIKKLVITEGLTTVSDKAFYGCHLLEEVTLPDTLTQIGQLAFFLCTALTTVNFPGSLHEIGTAAFARCDALSSITLYSGLQTIGIGAFKDTALTSVIIPSSVTFVGDNAFGYTEYNSQTPEQLTPVDDFVVYGEPDTAAETYADSNSFTFFSTTGTTGDCIWTFDPYTGTLTVSGVGAMQDYLGYDDYQPWVSLHMDILHIVINDGVTHIGVFAFRDCRNVLSVSLGNTVQTIGNYAFCQCGDEYANGNLTEITIPDSVEVIGHGAFYDNGYLRNITFGSGVKSIGELAFGKTDVKNVVLPDSVETIEKNAFQRCLNLKSVALNEGLTSIGEGAFKGCNDLNKVFIPKAVTSIGAQAFGFDLDGYDENQHYVFVKKDDFTIYGYPGCAKTYAIDNGFTFVAAGGDTGDCTWEFDPNTGTLTVSGEGRMDDVFVWYSHPDEQA